MQTSVSASLSQVPRTNLTFGARSFQLFETLFLTQSVQVIRSVLAAPKTHLFPAVFTPPPSGKLQRLRFT